MARVKGGPVAKNRRRKVLKQAKGYFGSKHRLFKTAQEQVFHSGAYAYRDRKQNKRNFRKLWIIRINAACRENGMSYSKFINGLEKAGIEINRKMLSEIAIDNPKYFAELVKISSAALDGKVVKAAPVKEEVKEVPVKEETPIVEPTPEVEETPIVVETPVEELPAPEVVEEAPADVVEEVKEEPVKEEPVKEEKTDLSKLTVAELKKMAKEKKIAGYTAMKKADLLKALN